MPMQYFLMEEGNQLGPMSLGDLVAKDIRPSSYIWHKGLDDWIQASEDPEVCRAMRRAMAGLDPETGKALPKNDSGNLLSDPRNSGISDTVNPDGVTTSTDQGNPAKDGSELRGLGRFLQNKPFDKYGVPPGLPQDDTDLDQRPSTSVALALIVAILFFPITGLFAVYFAFRSNALWKMSCQPGMSRDQVKDLRTRAHNDARLYKMMLGITISIGIIMVGVVISRTLL